MNILVITRELPPVGGGAGYVALNLAERVAAKGNHVFVVTMHFGDLPLFEKRGLLTIYRVKCGRRNQDSSYFLDMVRFVLMASGLVRELVRRESSMLIHAHAIIPDALIALAARGPRPFMIRAHGSDVPEYNTDQFKIAHVLLRPVWHLILRQADWLVAPSNFLAGLIKEARPRQQVLRIPNGINGDLFQSQPKRDGFLIVSRLVTRKNYHLFLEALGKIEEPQTVNIVGDGPALGQLKRLASISTQHNIFFHGWLAHGSPNWRQLYESSRFLIFPSESENFPINLLEGLLAGLIILASDIPSNREVLEGDAIYFPSLSIQDIEATTRRAIRLSPEASEKLMSDARSRVQSRYSWNVVSSSYLDVYRNMLGGADV